MLSLPVELILLMSLKCLSYNKTTIKLQWILSLFLLVPLFIYFFSFKEKGKELLILNKELQAANTTY